MLTTALLHGLPISDQCKKTMNTELRRQTVRNLKYNSIATLSVYIIQFVTNIILARILEPKDYGVVGFSQIFINFMIQFSDFGINGALIQRKELDKATLSTAFTLKAILSMVIVTVMLTLAPVSQVFMAQREVTSVIRLLSLNIILSTFAFLPLVLLTKGLEYQKLVLPQTVSVVLNSLTALIMAYSGFGFWSIVLGSIIGNLGNAVMLFYMKPHSLAFGYEAHIARELVRFGGSMLLPGLIIFIIFNTDNFVIGAARGATQLGYYALAFSWGSIVCTLLAGSFHKVLFPTFSKLQDDLSALKKSYLTSLHYIAFLAVPVNLILLILGKEFLIHILGRGTDRWLPALPVLQILCCYGVFRALLEPLGNVILGIGKPQLCLKANILAAVIELGLLYPAIHFYGIEGVAAAVTVAYMSQYAIYLPIMRREIDVKVGDLFLEVRTTLCAVLVMSATLLGLKASLGFSLATMVVQGLIGILVYLFVFGMIDRWRLFGEFRTLLRGAEFVSNP